MFKIVGKVNGIEQSIAYDLADGKGVITGDQMISYLVQWEFDNRTVVGPVGQYMEADVNEPLSVVFAIKKCFDSIDRIEGDIPEAEDIPEGSIC